jgi:CheY-like chemotaxis protein
VTIEQKTILVVDDSEGDAELMKRAFQKTGFNSRIQWVSDGQQAAAYLQGEGKFGQRSQFPLPNLVLLDHSLPGTSGWETLKWIRGQTQFAELPVVVFSGSECPEHEQRARALGANAYHVKPSDFAQFCAVIRRIGKFWLQQSPCS